MYSCFGIPKETAGTTNLYQVSHSLHSSIQCSLMETIPIAPWKFSVNVKAMFDQQCYHIIVARLGSQ